jgi:hypothetical protein
MLSCLILDLPAEYDSGGDLRMIVQTKESCSNSVQEKWSAERVTWVKIHYFQYQIMVPNDNKIILWSVAVIREPQLVAKILYRIGVEESRMVDR